MAASCTLPASWQRVLLVPLAKPKKNVHDPGSYRFIGLTSYLCKVFESLLQEVLHPHVGDLHHAQFGFRPGKSCTQLLSSLTCSLSSQLSRTRQRHRGHDALEHGKACILSLDFEKAFDKLAPVRVLDCLAKRGVPSQLTWLVKALLFNRRCKVVTQLGNSPWTLQRLGVTQGSVLGPWTWIVTMDDMLHRMERTGAIPRAFADDA
eukprot:5902153-Amphidinium_carterae.1